jgi:hypothetical protein
MFNQTNSLKSPVNKVKGAKIQITLAAFAIAGLSSYPYNSA